MTQISLASSVRKINCSIPAEVYLAIEEQLFDPSFGRPIYGARSRLIVLLLRKWIADPSLVPISIVTEGLKGTNE